MLICFLYLRTDHLLIEILSFRSEPLLARAARSMVASEQLVIEFVARHKLLARWTLLSVKTLTDKDDTNE